MRVDERGFVSLAQALRAAPPPPIEAAAADSVAPSSLDAGDDGPVAGETGRVVDAELSPPAPATATAEDRTHPAAETAAALRSARVFTAALADAGDALLGDLLRAIAIEIVGRELQLGAVDVAAIARRLIAERRADAPLRVRVAPADGSISCELPVVIDPALAPGDAILECRAGGVDARLSVRLALLAERFA